MSANLSQKSSVSWNDTGTFRLRSSRKQATPKNPLTNWNDLSSFFSMLAMAAIIVYLCVR